MSLEQKKLFLLFTFILVIPAVLAAPDIFTQVFDSIGGKDIDIGLTYLKYNLLIDAIVYFVLFIAICTEGFKKIPQFSDNKTLPVILGIVLAISMTVIARNRFMLMRDLGPYVVIFLLLILTVPLFNYLKGMGTGKLVAFALTFLVVSIFFNLLVGVSASSDTEHAGTTTMKKLATNPAVNTAMTLANVAATIILIGAVFSLFKSKKNGGFDLNAAKNYATEDDKNWKDTITDIKDSEEADATAAGEFDKARKEFTDLTAGEKNLELSTEYDLQREKAALDQVKKVIDDTLRSVEWMDNPKEANVYNAQREKQVEIEISRRTDWLKNNLPRLGQYIAKDKDNENRIAQALAQEGNKVAMMLKDIRDINNHNAAIRSNLQRTDMAIYAMVKDQLDKVDAAAKANVQIDGKLKDDLKELKRLLDQIRMLLQTSIMKINDSTNIVNTKILTNADASQPIHSMSIDTLKQLRQNIIELENATNGRLQAHSTIKQKELEIQTEIKACEDTLAASIKDNQKALSQIIDSAIKEAGKDKAVFASLLTIIDTYMKDARRTDINVALIDKKELAKKYRDGFVKTALNVSQISEKSKKELQNLASSCSKQLTIADIEKEFAQIQKILTEMTNQETTRISDLEKLKGHTS